ncbi:hypothetical protein CYJ10_24360 [Cupriavidus pauculus]|uniref:Uncharacterized protein n=1 Tax=Cupriavidus pauculus TaxID=82633 RepID=A0A2N5C6S6_9BURK|nr:hypothetical protein CYJ10_24360 [Cupriavidus pauculus]
MCLLCESNGRDVKTPGAGNADLFTDDVAMPLQIGQSTIERRLTVEQRLGAQQIPTRPDGRRGTRQIEESQNAKKDPTGGSPEVQAIKRIEYGSSGFDEREW